MKAKERILKLMNDGQDRATSKIAGLLNIDYRHTLKLLTDLEKEGLIGSIKHLNRTYWNTQLKKEGGKT